MFYLYTIIFEIYMITLQNVLDAHLKVIVR